MARGTRRKDILALLALVLASNGLFLVLTFDVARRWFVPLDDAYIYFQYAARAAGGDPFSYQPGAGFSTGATSPLYPLLLAPFAALMEMRALAGLTAVLSFLWKFLAAAGVYTATLRLARHRAPALLAGSLTALSGVLTYGVMNGMETGMFAAALALALAALASPRKATRGRMGLVSGLLAWATLARPEAALIPATLLVVSLWPRWRLKEYRAAFLMSLIPVCLYILVCFIQTGAIGTSTASSKLITAHPYQSEAVMAGRALAQADELLRLKATAELGLPPVFLLAASAGLIWLARRRRLDAAVFLLPLIVSLFSVNPFLNSARYFAAFLPVLIVLWVIGAWAFVIWLRKSGGAWIWRVAVVASLLAVAPTLFGRAREFSQHAAEMDRMHFEAGEWIDENLPEEAVVGVHDAGILAGAGNRPIVDFNGLVSPEFFNISASTPGGLYETIAGMPFSKRPTHHASFPSWLHPALRTETLARFPFEQNDWASGETLTVWGAAIFDTTAPLRPVDWPKPWESGWQILDSINHAELESEAAHDYTPELTNRWELDPFSFLRRLPASRDSALVLTEGGRLLTGEESFNLRCHPARPGRLVIRCRAERPALLAIHVGDHNEEMRLRDTPGEFQELCLDVPPGAFEGEEVEVRVELERGGPNTPEGVEIYRAWLMQKISEDHPAAHEYETRVAETERRFEEGMLDWFGEMDRSTLPMGEEYQLFWHTGFRYEAEGEAVFRRLDNVRMALGVPVREIGENPAIRFRGEQRSADPDLWGMIFWFEIDGKESERTIVRVATEQNFIVPLDPALIGRGINHVRLRADRLYNPSAEPADGTGDPYYPDLWLSEVELIDLGWGGEARSAP